RPPRSPLFPYTTLFRSPRDRPFPEIELGLVVKEEFAALQTAAQARLQRHPPERMKVHFFGVELVGVLAFILRSVHGDVGVFHQRDRKSTRLNSSHLVIS